MSEKLTRIEVDCVTGNQKIIELTASEIAELEKMKELYLEAELKREAEEKAQAQIKASALAKLAELGLTEEEAKAIID